MNKIYRVIWNANLGVWVAVSELAKSHTKSKNNLVSNLSIVEAQGESIATQKVHRFSLHSLTLIIGLMGAGALFATTQVMAVTGTEYQAGTDIPCFFDAQTESVICGDNLTEVKSPATGAVVLGSKATVSAKNAIAVGLGAEAAGESAVAIGTRAQADARSAVAIGDDAFAEGDYSFALGTGAHAMKEHAVAMGNNATANTYDVAIGAGALMSAPPTDTTVAQTKSTGENTAIGGNAGQQLAGGRNVVVGVAAATRLEGDSNTVMGSYAGSDAKGSSNVITGSAAGVSLQGSSNVLSGQSAGTLMQGNSNISSGGFSGAIVVGNHNVTQGTAAGAVVKGNNNINLGYQAGSKIELDANGNPVLKGAVDKNAPISDTNPGVPVDVNDNNLIDLVTGAPTTTYNNAVNIGYQTKGLADGAVAVGSSSNVTVQDGVALGSSSEANRVAIIGPLTSPTSSAATNTVYAAENQSIADKNAIIATVKGKLGAVSVGSSTATRQITNVAAGSEDSDVVNVAQLKAVANTPLGFTDDAGTQLTRKLGENLNVKGGATGTLTEGNIGVVASGTDTLTVKLAQNVDLGSSGSLKIGDTTVNTAGVQIINGAAGPVNLTANGLDNGGNKILNVAAGTSNTDAVNFQQLKDAMLNVKDVTRTSITRNSPFAYATTPTNDSETTVALIRYILPNGDVAFFTRDQLDENGIIKADQVNNGYTGEVRVAALNPTEPQVTTPTLITNIDEGRQDTDAVNVKQLKGVISALGGGAQMEADGSVTQPFYKITKTDGTTYDDARTVEAALQNLNNEVIKPLSFSANDQTATADQAVQRTLGTTLSIKGGITETDPSKMPTSGENVITRTTADGINIELAKNVKFDSVSVQDAARNQTLIDANGLNFTDAAGEIRGPGITVTGISAGNTIISEVADGVASTDAVNVQQLQTVANTPLGFKGDIGTDVSRKLGETLTVKGGKTTGLTDSNIGVVADDTTNTLTIKLAEAVNLGETGSLTINNTNLNTDGLTITGSPSVTTTGINAGGSPITNVASGGTTTSNAANIGDVNNAVAAAKTHYYSVNDGGMTRGNYNNDGATGQYAIAVGPDVRATGLEMVAIGHGAGIGSQNNNLNIAIGASAGAGQTTTGAPGNNVSIGRNAGKNAVGDRNTFIGAQNVGASSLGSLNTALGHAAFFSSEGDYNTSLGIYSGQNSEGSNNTSLGGWAGRYSSGDYNVAIGDDAGSGIAADSTVSIGQTAYASANDAIAIGKFTTAEHEGSVALGSLSVTEAAVATTQAIVGPFTYSGFAGTTPLSTVSIGSLGNERTLTNVAAGRISAKSTDAINGSQLFATNTVLGNVADTTVAVLGGDAVVDAAGTISMTNVGGTGEATVHDAIQSVAENPLTFAGDTGTNVKRKLGETVNVKGGETDKSKLTDNNIGVVADGTNTLTVKLAQNVNLGDFGSLKIGSTTVDTTGVNINNGVTSPVSLTVTGLNNGNNKILNVAPGTSNTDAVNVAQLNDVATSIKNITRTSITRNSPFAYATTPTNNSETTVALIRYILPNGDVAFFRPDQLDTDGKVKPEEEANAYTGAVRVAALNAREAQVTTPTLITNIAEGRQDYDAVNVKQLKVAVNALGGGAQVDEFTGNVVAPTYTIQKTDGTKVGVHTVEAALENLNNEVIKPLTFAGDSGTNVERKLGTTINVKGNNKGTLTDGNIGVVTNGTDTLEVKLAEAIDLGKAGSVTTGNSKINNDGLTIVGGPSVTTGGINAGNQQITNVLSGGTTDTNAANIGDVQKAATAAKTTVSAGSNVVVTKTTDATTGADNYQVATAADVNFDKVTVGNVVVDKATNKITGIEAGTETKDAVNKGQLDALATQQATADALNVKYDSTAKDKVTLGGAGSTTPVQVSNVKAGDLSATSTDAVNGSQLYATNQNVATNSNSITNLQNQTFKLQANGDTASAVKASDTVQFLNGDNINISRNGNNITVATAKTVAFDKVTVGNVVVDKTTSKITGLTAGTDDLDAVNVSQLKAVQAAATTTENFAVKYDQNTDGSVNKDSVTLTGTTATATKDANTGNITTTGGTSIKNVASAGDYKDLANANKAVNAGDLNNAVLDASNNVKNILGGATTVAADGSISNSNIGGTGQSTIHDAIAAVNNAAVQAKNTVSAGENITVTASKNADGSNNYQVATKKDVNFDSVKVGDVSVSAAGIQAGNQKVTNVADGAINAGSKDAVNGSQLNNTNQKVVEYLGGGAGYDNITQSFNNPTYTVGHGSTAQQYNNVGGAIDALNQADAALDNRITNLGDQLQQAFYSTNERIDTVEKRANAGIAAAMALENAPYIPGKYTYAAGAAYHGGENAIGLTLRKTADNGRWSLTGGVAAGSQGDPSVRIGISGVID